MKHEPFLNLATAREIGREPEPKVPAVYFLYQGDRLKYVGQSINPLQRISSHNLRVGIVL